MNAAKVLLRLAADTNLLTESLSSPRRVGSLLLCLNEIRMVSNATKRSRRTDAGMQEFVRLVDAKAVEVFGDAPTSLVAALARLASPGADAATLKTYAKRARSARTSGTDRGTN